MAKILLGLGIVTVSGLIVFLAVAAGREEAVCGSLTQGQVAFLPDAGRTTAQAAQPADAVEARRRDKSSTAVSEAAGQTTLPKKNTEPRGSGDALAAVERAADAKRYLFIFFYRSEDEKTREMRKVFDAVTRKVADRADAVAINAADPREKKMVDKFNVSRAPMPLVLAMAPNGAITGGFPAEVELDEKKLRGALAGPCMQKCLKSLQDRKLVFLCVQNERTRSNDAAMQGVRDFKADARFAQATEIVTVDPSDPAEEDTLTQLQIDPKTSEATTMFLAPPGRIIARFTGATNKDLLVATVQKAASGCGAGGCGPSGCAPKRK